MAVQQDLPAEEDSLSGSNRLSTFTTEDVSIVEGAVRYDIHFMVCLPGQGERVEAIINIEVQNNDTPGYPIVKRGIYYGSRMISAQRGTGFKNQEYNKIKKVMSIWICEDTAKQRADSMNEYSFTEQCRRGIYQEQQKNYDLIRVVILRLGKEGERSQDDAIRLLSCIFSEEKTPEDKMPEDKTPGEKKAVERTSVERTLAGRSSEERISEGQENTRMRLIVGGAFQGKLDYAKKICPDTEWTDGSECELEEIAACSGMNRFHLFVRRWMKAGRTKEELTDAILKDGRELTLICDDVGCGLVPVDAFEREYRETAGRICTALAERSSRVDRVVCGIGIRIK